MSTLVTKKTPAKNQGITDVIKLIEKNKKHLDAKGMPVVAAGEVADLALQLAQQMNIPAADSTAAISTLQRLFYTKPESCKTSPTSSVSCRLPRTGNSSWRRVCWPASVSSFSVLSSAHVMFSRPGTRMLPAAP